MRMTKSTASSHALIAIAALSLLALPTASSSAQGTSNTEPIPGLDAYVNRAMATWKVPGLALAIVRNDSVIYVKGYGVRSIESKAPVDGHTVFAIGSDTKAFTGALVAMMVTDGKMRYDDPITRYLPQFEMYDPWVTREATIRDALTHRIGLNQHDAVWYGTHLSPDELVHRLRFIKPDFSFRSKFGYSNMMYVVAGDAAAAAAGESWSALIHDRIFVPLGMTSSNTSVTDLVGQSNVAIPHGQAHDTIYTMPYRNVDDVAPAGAVNSNAIDMAQWLRFQLAGGVYNGKRLVGAQPFLENHTSQTIMGTTPPAASVGGLSQLLTYGMGWIVTDYRRHQLLMHDGGIDGMHSFVGMLPEQHFGVIMLTNLNVSGVVAPLRQWIFDHELGVNPVPDWSADMHRAAARGEAAMDASRRARDAQREPNTQPSLPLTAYTGTYGDSTFGTVTVALVEGKLTLTRGDLTGVLTHWHHDVFQADWNIRWIESSFVEFAVGPLNRVDTLTVDVLGDHLVLAHEHAAGPRPGQ